MGCTISSDIIPEVPQNIAEIRHEVRSILHKLDAIHMGHHTLESYTINGIQDAQYSPNITAQDRVNLDRLWYICGHYTIIAKSRVSDFF